MECLSRRRHLLSQGLGDFKQVLLNAFPTADLVNKHKRRKGPLQVQWMQNHSTVLHKSSQQKLPAPDLQLGGKGAIGCRHQLLCSIHMGNKKQQTDIQSDTKLWRKLSTITATHPNISAKRLLSRLLYKWLNFIHTQTRRRQNAIYETPLKYAQKPILSKTLLLHVS